MTDRTNSIATIPFEAKLDTLARIHDIDRHDVDEQVALRVSTSATQALNNQTNPDGVLAQNPAVKLFLEEHEERLIAGDDADLARHHILRVNEGDLAPGFASNKRVGYVGLSQNPATKNWTVILAVVNSAVLRRLPSQEQTTGLSAWVQMVTWTWKWAAACLNLRFVRNDRMSRDLEVFAAINGRVKERAGAVYWWGDERIDPHTDDWRAVIGGQTSATDATETKKKLLNGRANAWQRSAWTEKEAYLPVGLHLPEIVDGHGVTTKSDQPAIDPVTQPIAQTMFEHAAAGWTWIDIAAEAAADGATNGRGALLALKVAPYMTDEQIERARNLADDLPDAVSTKLTDALDRARDQITDVARNIARQAAVEFCKRTFSKLSLYRDGYLWKMHVNTLPGRTKLDDHLLTFVVQDARLAPSGVDDDQVFTEAEFEDRYPDHPLFRVRESDPDYYAEICHVGFVDGQIALPSPVTLTDVEWQAVEEAVPCAWLTQKRTGRRKAEQSIPTAPLSQLSWDTGDTSWRIWFDHGTYILLCGERGAKAAEMERIAKVPCGAVHQQLGRWWVDLAERMEEAVAPLPVLRSATPDVSTSDPVAIAETNVARLEEDIARKNAEYDGALRELSALDPEADSSQRRRHEKLTDLVGDVEVELDTLEAELADATAELSRARSAPLDDRSSGEPEEVTLDVDANPLIVVGARLLRLADEDRHTDIPQMSRAVAWLLNNGDLVRLRRGEGRDVVLEFRGVRVPGRDVPQILDGATFTLTDTTGRLRGKPTDPTLPTLRDEAARWVFANQAGQEFRELHDWSFAFLVEELRDWLQERDIAPGATNAAIDASLVHLKPDDDRIPVGPALYAWLTTSGTDDDRRSAARNAAAELGAEQMADPIIDAYITHGDAWPQRSTGWTRRPTEPTRDLIQLLADQPRNAVIARPDVAEALATDTTALRNLVQQDAPMHFVGLDNGNLWALECNRADRGGRCPGTMTLVCMFPETMLLHGTEGAVVACDRCYRPAGDFWTDRELPPVYRKRWTAPGPTVNQMAQEDRSCIAPTPPKGNRQLPERTFSMATAARKLNIGTASLKRLTHEGVIHAIAVKDKRGGYRIPAREILRAEVVAAAAALRERRYPTTD